MLYQTEFLISLILTLCLEIPVVFLALRIISYRANKWRILSVAIMATMLTIPYVWFFFPGYFVYPYYICTGELFALIIEAIIYWQFLKLSLKKAILVSFAANLSSFLVGFILSKYLF
jgi:hypothetical protein